MWDVVGLGGIERKAESWRHNVDTEVGSITALRVSCYPLFCCCSNLFLLFLLVVVVSLVMLLLIYVVKVVVHYCTIVTHSLAETFHCCECH